MQSLLESCKAEIDAFVEQRDDFLMLLAVTDMEAPIALQLVRDVEQANETDAFLLFADDFVAAQPYVDVLVERLREHRELACQWLVEQGREPLPEPPAALGDYRRDPVKRLAAAMRYAVDILPRGGGHRLIWTMVPQNVADMDAWHEFVDAFAPRQGLRPGLRGLRLLCRTVPDCKQAYPELVGAPRVRLRGLDLRQNKLEAAMAEDVEDESRSDEQRMQALLSLALFDYAFGRQLDALNKLKLLLGYYQGTGDDMMQAFVMNAVGDVYHRGGELDNAQHWYECALPPIIAAKDPVVFHTVVRNLGDVAFAKGEYAVASQHFGSAAELADKGLNAEGRVRDLEARGLSLEKIGSAEEAVESWETAAVLARHVAQPSLPSPLLRPILEHLSRGYRANGDGTRLADVRRELATLDGGSEPA